MADNLKTIKPLLIGALESACNRYLGLDEQLADLLAPMVGKVIALHISSFDETLYICPAQDHLQFLTDYSDQPDTCLSGSLLALGLMGLSAKPMRALFSGEVVIEGDTQLAHQFQRLFEKLDIDLESRLARYTGEQLAQRLTGFWHGGRRFTEQSFTTFRLNLEEFLQEETRDLPAKPEAEVLFEQIDTLRSDVDRLTARIERLLPLSHHTPKPQ